MTREEYRTRLSEIYNQIGELASERDKMILDRCRLIEKDLESMGLKFGDGVDIIDDTTERRVTFTGVRNNSQFYIYLEFIYAEFSRVVVQKVVDINHDIKVILPHATFDYHTFMKQYQ